MLLNIISDAYGSASGFLIASFCSWNKMDVHYSFRKEKKSVLDIYSS